MVDLSIVMLNYQRVLKKNIVFCCVFPVRLSWLFVVFEKDFSGFGGDLWLVTFLPFAAFVAFGDFCFSASYLLVFVLFFLASYSFGLGGFWAVCWYWYLVSPCSFQPSRNIWIRRVRSMPRFIVSMARLKHAQALWKKSLTLLWTFMKRTRSVYDMWPLLWIVYELYVNSMWQVCDMFLKRQLIWDACGMQLKCMWIYIKSIHTEVSGYTSKYAGNYMYAAKHSKRLFF